MSGEGDTAGRGSGSLEAVRDVEVPEKSTARLVLDQFVDRWKTVGAIVVLAVTSFLLWYMDCGVTTDAIVFTVLTVLLAAYFVLTLRNDIKLE